MFYHEHAWGAGQWVAMGLGMIVFWGLVVLVVIALVRWVGAAGRSGPHQPAGYAAAPPAAPPAPATGQPSGALQILQERFARGEISEEEYIARRDILQGR